MRTIRIPHHPLRAMWQPTGLALAIALVADISARRLPLVGAPVLSIVLGILVRVWRPSDASDGAGLRSVSKYALQAGVVVSGFGISFQSVLRTGSATLPVTLSTIAAALLLAVPAARLLGLDKTLRTLIGVGTAICGASAIAAVAAVVAPSEGELVVALATIFFYNILAVLTFPAAGHFLHLSQSAFGVWAGTAVNDTSSVLAAGYAYGAHAGTYATIVKLTRATLILPIVAAIAVMEAAALRRAGRVIAWHAVVPWFIIWFLVAALVNSSGVVPVAAHGVITDAATFLISLALAAVGLQTRLKTLREAGPRPLFFGGVLWLAVAMTSLAVQHFCKL